MSEIAGSRSSTSSGPRPNSSLSTSVISASRSNRLSGIEALSRSTIADDEAADFRLRVLAAHAREPLEIEPIQQLLMNAALQLLVVGTAGIDAAAGHHHPSLTSSFPSLFEITRLPARAARTSFPASLFERRRGLLRRRQGAANAVSDATNRCESRARSAAPCSSPAAPDGSRSETCGVSRCRPCAPRLHGRSRRADRPGQHQAQPIAAVALPQGGRHAARAAHCCELLVGDQHDLGRPRANRARSCPIGARRARCTGTPGSRNRAARNRPASNAAVIGRPEAPSRSRPALVRTTRPRKYAASRRLMFSSASSTENRGSPPRNTAASPHAMFRSISSVEPGLAFASAVATFTATVVAPTPPLAPMNANTSPRTVQPSVRRAV